MGWRTYGFIRSALLTIAAVVGAISIVAVAYCVITGARPLIVISGSMEPTIPTGSVVFSTPGPAGDVGRGDIATLERPRGLGLITHRVVSTKKISSDGWQITMKGDANKTADPEPYQVSTAGRYRFHVARLGYVAEFIRGGNGLALPIAVGLLLLAVFVMDPARLRSDRPRAGAHAHAGPPSEGGDGS